MSTPPPPPQWGPPPDVPGQPGATPSQFSGPPQGYQPGYGQPAVQPKNPALALLGSFFVPGLGSFMNGEGGKGIIILVGYVISLLLMFVLIGFFTAPIFWIWGMVDGYQGAQRWNAQHGIVS